MCPIERWFSTVLIILFFLNTLHCKLLQLWLLLFLTLRTPCAVLTTQNVGRCGAARSCLLFRPPASSAKETPAYSAGRLKLGGRKVGYVAEAGWVAARVESSKSRPRYTATAIAIRSKQRRRGKEKADGWAAKRLSNSLCRRSSERERDVMAFLSQ